MTKKKKEEYIRPSLSNDRYRPIVHCWGHHLSFRLASRPTWPSLVDFLPLRRGPASSDKFFNCLVVQKSLQLEMSASSFPFFSVKHSFDIRMRARRDLGQPALPVTRTLKSIYCSRDRAWRRRGTTDDHKHSHVPFFSTSVWPFSCSNFNLILSPPVFTEKNLSDQSLWFWSLPKTPIDYSFYYRARNWTFDEKSLFGLFLKFPSERIFWWKPCEKFRDEVGIKCHQSCLVALVFCTKLYIKLAVSLCLISQFSFPFNFRTANALVLKFGTLPLSCLLSNTVLAIFDIIFRSRVIHRFVPKNGP